MNIGECKHSEADSGLSRYVRADLWCLGGGCVCRYFIFWFLREITNLSLVKTTDLHNSGTAGQNMAQSTGPNKNFMVLPNIEGDLPNAVTLWKLAGSEPYNHLRSSKFEEISTEPSDDPSASPIKGN